MSEGPTKLDEFASKALGEFGTYVTGSAAAMKDWLEDELSPEKDTKQAEDESPVKETSSPEFKDPALDNFCRQCQELRTGDRKDCKKCGKPYYEKADVE